MLRTAWANGVRYVDTAKSYGSEPMIGAWMNAVPIGCNVWPSDGHAIPTISPSTSPASICNGRVE